MDKLYAATAIGFVMQNPDNQIVTDKVWHELAFGLESLGLKTPEIRLRVAEMASFFGIQTWFHKPVAELSGGQKQILSLASIMALQPSALILDEPTGQLDPIAASEFLATVGKINRELGVTVILTEQRLEEAYPISTRAAVIDEGKLIAEGTPQEVALALSGRNHGMFLAMPTPMRVWLATQEKQEAGSGTKAADVPITVRDGANWLRNIMETAAHTDQPPRQTAAARTIKRAEKEQAAAQSLPQQVATKLDEVWFKYDKNMPDVIKDLSFEARYGEFTAILGGNGTGKTTALSLIAKLNKPYRGKVSTDTQAYSLPQNPQSLFIAKTVREDLLEILSERKIPENEKQKRLTAMTALCRLERLLDAHPYDLSGGEQQRAALAKVLLLQPKILLLDEPTKGLDAEFKLIFASIIKKLTEAGASVVMASHDVEFCAEHADRCALFFDGSIITENAPRPFFSGNSFYTTSANRMARDTIPEAVTASDIISRLNGQLPPAPEAPTQDPRPDPAPEPPAQDPHPSPAAEATPPATAKPRQPKLPSLQKTIAAAFAALLLATIIFAAARYDGIKAFISGGNEAFAAANEGAPLYVGIMLALSGETIGLTVALTRKRGKTKPKTKTTGSGPPKRKLSKRTTAGSGLPKRKLSKRTIAAAAMILLAIPATIYIGSYFFGDRKYYFISLLIILETMLPFAMAFESRKPQARELVIIAVLCAIAVAGRAAFFMLPQFKPVVALVIIAGVAFGGEAGFLVGAMTGFVSNFFFGQGPWTPWQMFAFGAIGFLAGILFHKGMLRREKTPLAVFGAFATLIIYGGIMNPAFVIIYQGAPTKAMFLAAYLQGIPFDLVHAAATMTFMLLVSQPMLEKLDRIKEKYGLMINRDYL